MPIARSVIQSTIKAALEAVTGVENVYNDTPRAADVNEFIDRFVQDNDTQVQYWVIRRLNSAANTSDSTGGARGIPIRSSVFFDHRFLVELWYGLRFIDGIESNEPEFQALIDATLDAFKAKRTLGGWSTFKPLELARIRDDYAKGTVHCRVAEFEVTIIDTQNNLAPA